MGAPPKWNGDSFCNYHERMNSERIVTLGFKKDWWL